MLVTTIHSVPISDEFIIYWKVRCDTQINMERYNFPNPGKCYGKKQQNLGIEDRGFFWVEPEMEVLITTLKSAACQWPN